MKLEACLYDKQAFLFGPIIKGDELGPFVSYPLLNFNVLFMSLFCRFGILVAPNIKSLALQMA
jgi:hypothetical protein